MYDFNSDELTWYVFGKERIAKFKHQYNDVLQKVTNDVSSIPLAGMNQELIDALAPLHEWNTLIQKSEFTLPNTLLLINLTASNTLTYILQSHEDLIGEPYTQVASYDITEETNQFAFTMADGTIGYFSLEELFDMLGLVANNITLSPSIDPFDIPIAVPTTVEEPDFHYYIYDHLGNTRIVYSTTIPSCGGYPHYTLEAVMDYFPYGKTLREFIKTPEKYVTTHHERDVETGLDYRGARFYDSDVARFLSLDPHAADYPELSDYCYVAGNPVMFIDPDGKNIIIWYSEEEVDKETGKKHTVNKSYEYGSETEVPNNAFVKATIESIDYLVKNGVGDIKGENVNILDKLINDNKTVNIHQSSRLDEFYQNSGDIVYNPWSGNIVSISGKQHSGGKQTPALGLLHEFGHAYGYHFDNTNFNQRVNMAHPEYYDYEEKYVIENIETPAAEKLGEGIRNTSNGIEYRTAGPTTIDTPTQKAAKEAAKNKNKK